MAPTKAFALPAFHALTVCDNTSFFPGTGKKPPWQVGHKTQSYNSTTPSDGKTITHPSFLAQERNLLGKWDTKPNLTTALRHLMERPHTISPDDIQIIEGRGGEPLKLIMEI